MIWLWREQHKIGAAVVEDSFAARLGIPVKALYRRVATIPQIQAVLDGRRGHWCYYAKRNPAGASQAVTTQPLRAGHPDRVSKVRT